MRAAPALVASTQEGAEAKIGEAIKAYGDNADIDPMSVLKFALHWKIPTEPIIEGFELAEKLRASSRLETQPLEAPQPLGAGKLFGRAAPIDLRHALKLQHISGREFHE